MVLTSVPSSAGAYSLVNSITLSLYTTTTEDAMDALLRRTEDKVRKALQELQRSDKDDIPPSILNRMQAIYLEVPKGVDRDVSRFFFSNILELADSPKGIYNVGLVFSRGVKQKACGYRHCFITQDMIDMSILGTTSFLAVLYLWQNDIFGFKAVENCTKEFRAFLNYSYPGYYVTFKEVFCYVYAVLHNAPYTTKYCQYLVIDYPRIPFVKSLDTFLELAYYGNNLIEWHLQTPSVLYEARLRRALFLPETTVPKDAVFKVVRNQYDPETCRVYLNEKNYLPCVSPEVYNYRIGEYQVLRKFIYDYSTEHNKGPHRRPLTIVAYHDKLMDIVDTIYASIHIESQINYFDVPNLPMIDNCTLSPKALKKKYGKFAPTESTDPAPQDTEPSLF